VAGEMAPEVPVGFGSEVGRKVFCDISSGHLVPQLYCCLTSFR
jgi:hypothetical protein